MFTNSQNQQAVEPVIVSDSIKFGPSRTTLPLSTKSWPASAVLCGIVLVFVGMFFLFPKNPWKVYRNGLSKVGKYVEQLIESREDGTAIIISEADDSNAVSMVRKGRNISLFVVSRMSIEAKIESFFSRHAIKPISGVSLVTKGIGDDVCCCEFALAIDPNVNTELILTLFTDLFGVDDSMALKFREMRP